MVRDPWLAANLSLSWAGLGQLAARRWLSGSLFFLLELSGWVGFIGWFLLPGVTVPALLFLLGLSLLARTASVIHAWRVCRGEPNPGKNPWRSYFLARFIPGLGHAYAGRWVRAPILFVLAAFMVFYPVDERWAVIAAFAWVFFRSAVLLDSFWVLRRSNGVGSRTTRWALAFLFLFSLDALLALPCKRFVGELYKIPSSAMEPTLMGDLSENHRACPFDKIHALSPAGDRIVVSRLAYSFGEIERYDLAVFTFPLNQSKNFIKRVVGLPGEEMMIYDGDIYVKGKGEPKFRIARKPLLTQDSLWILVSEAGNLGSFREHWEPVDGAKAEEAGGLALEGKFLLKSPVGNGDGTGVGDLRVFLEVRTENPGTSVSVSVEGGPPSFVARVGDGCRLEVKEGGSSRTIGAPSGVDLTPGAWHSYDLSLYDGLALLRLDGKSVAQDEFRGERGERREGPFPVSLSVKGGRALVRALSVGRDLHYLGKRNIDEGVPVRIPEGRYVMLGDNALTSHDARNWERSVIKLKDGRMIVYESQERRWHETGMMIQADSMGREVSIERSEIVEELSGEPFVFVDRSYFVGRVLKVWWPLARARPVR